MPRRGRRRLVPPPAAIRRRVVAGRRHPGSRRRREVPRSAPAALLLPPYRDELEELLAEQVVDTVRLSGPMVRSEQPRAGACWVDGLDSV